MRPVAAAFPELSSRITRQAGWKAHDGLLVQSNLPIQRLIECLRWEELAEPEVRAMAGVRDTPESAGSRSYRPKRWIAVTLSAPIACIRMPRTCRFQSPPVR
jgi:hypothetical protein